MNGAMPASGTFAVFNVNGATGSPTTGPKGPLASPGVPQPPGGTPQPVPPAALSTREEFLAREGIPNLAGRVGDFWEYLLSQIQPSPPGIGPVDFSRYDYTTPNLYSDSIIDNPSGVLTTPEEFFALQEFVDPATLSNDDPRKGTYGINQVTGQPFGLVSQPGAGFLTSPQQREDLTAWANANPDQWQLAQFATLFPGLGTLSAANATVDKAQFMAGRVRMLGMKVGIHNDADLVAAIEAGTFDPNAAAAAGGVEPNDAAAGGVAGGGVAGGGGGGRRHGQTPAFDPTSVTGHLTGLLATDSPLMQQAQTTGLQIANRRGLLNSSIAVSAAQNDMIRAALPIASQEASQAAVAAAQESAQVHATALQEAQLGSAAQLQASAQAATASLQESSEAAAEELARISVGSQERVAALNVSAHDRQFAISADGTGEKIRRHVESGHRQQGHPGGRAERLLRAHHGAPGF